MSLTKKATEVQEVFSKTTLMMDQVDQLDLLDQIHWMAKWMGLGLGWCLVWWMDGLGLAHHHYAIRATATIGLGWERIIL